MTYVKKSVPRPEGNPGVGLRPMDCLSLFDVDDIAVFPQPDANGVVIADNIIMKEGRYAIEIYGTPGTFEATSNSEGDTDKTGFKPSVKASHPGNSQVFREFKHNFANKRVIAVLKYCSGKPADLIGTPCNPCSVSFAYTGNADSNANEFTVSQIMKGHDMFIYKGTIPTEEPVAVVPGGGKSVTVTTGGVYQLSPGAVTIDTIAGGSDGMVMTLAGCESDSPTVVPTNGKIVLADAKPFVASKGSVLTLKAYKVPDTQELIWVETSRYTQG